MFSDKYRFLMFVVEDETSIFKIRVCLQTSKLFYKFELFILQ